MVNNILIRWYHVKIDEIKILEEVARIQKKIENSRDDLYLARTLLIKSSLGYKDKPEEFKQLYTSLIKRNLLELIESQTGTYLRITEAGKKCLAEYESFVRSSWLHKLGKILEHHFSPVLISLVAIILSIISIYFSVHKDNNKHLLTPYSLGARHCEQTSTECIIKVMDGNNNGMAKLFETKRVQRGNPAVE